MTSGLPILHSINENETAMHLRLESWALWPLPSLDRDLAFVTEIELPIEQIDDLHSQPILRGGEAPMTASLSQRLFRAAPDVSPDSPRP